MVQRGGEAFWAWPPPVWPMGVWRGGAWRRSSGGKKAAPPPAIVVETHRGKVRGTVDDGIKVFKGIPYAAATDGLNRFRPPKPAKLWPDVRDAIAYGPMCPQLAPGTRQLHGVLDLRQGCQRGLPLS